jgi:2OG-Fe(II) oxygenase superfamily
MQEIPAFFFDTNELERRVAEGGGPARFRTAAPFPHVVLDDLVPADVMRRLIAEFPGEDDVEWITSGPGRTLPAARGRSNKLGLSDERCFPPFIRYFMGQLLSATFVEFLEKISGIEGLIVDPAHNGCGLHSTGPGGRLMIHTDVNRHPHSRQRLHQVLNLIVYLNEDWEESYEGQLELWTADRRPCKTILPIANRAVLFETSTRSFHGHPEPLACPEGRRRNSLAVYYYCLDRPPSDDYEGMQRSVHWIPTSEDDRVVAADIANRAERVSIEMSGMRATLPAGLLPVQIGDQTDAWAHVTVMHESTLPDELRTVVREGRVAAMFTGDGDGAPLERCYIIGYVNSAAGKEITEDGSCLLVCGRDDGALYLEHPETGKALFCGYFEMLERLLGGRVS